MIEINELNENDRGRWVEYQPAHDGKEKGRIKSWNDKWVFVVYNCGENWSSFMKYTAAATSPKELTFTTPPEPNERNQR